MTRNKPNKDLRGLVYGRLTITEHVIVDGRHRWRCCCECGGEKIANHSDLRRGEVKSCGCLQRENRNTHKGPAYINDLTDKRYGHLLVMSFVPQEKKEGTFWLAKCDCGNEEIFRVDALSKRKSCSLCRDKDKRLKREAAKAERDRIAQVLKQSKADHGHTKGGKTTITYNSWRAMIKRCTYPKHDRYPSYGGRGIEVDPRWLDFRNFLRDMGERPNKGMTLERDDVNGNYEPGNVRWATQEEQIRNTRRDLPTEVMSPLYSVV